jgi:hypothetical protein
MRVRLAEARLTEELTVALREAGCVSVAGEGGVVHVGLPTARDDREEAIELTFFLKAWQARCSSGELELEA